MRNAWRPRPGLTERVHEYVWLSERLLGSIGKRGGRDQDGCAGRKVHLFGNQLGKIAIRTIHSVQHPSCNLPPAAVPQPNRSGAHQRLSE